MLPFYITMAHDQNQQVNTDMMLLTKIETLSEFHQFFHFCPFSVPGTHPGSHNSFISHAPLVSANLCSSQSCLVFHDFDSFKALFCSVLQGFVWCFLIILGWSYAFDKKIMSDAMPFSLPWIRGTWYQHDLSIGDVNPDHLVKMVYAGLLQKLLFSSR